MTNSIEPSTDSKLAERVRRGRGRPRQETHEPVREPQGRAERIPLGVPRLQLTADKRPGFVRRWVNDQADRIAQAQKGGYDHVKDADGNKVVRSGSKSESLRVYLMEIREDWYVEDQLAKHKEIDDRESLIRRGEQGGKPGVDGRYIPSQGIKIGQRAGRPR